VHSSSQPTSSRQNHKQTPSKMLYVNLLLHLINLNTVPIYELNNTNIEKEWHWQPNILVFLISFSQSLSSMAATIFQLTL
jgi:hypothetical protein